MNNAGHFEGDGKHSVGNMNTMSGSSQTFNSLEEGGVDVDNMDHSGELEVFGNHQINKINTRDGSLLKANG